MCSVLIATGYMYFYVNAMMKQVAICYFDLTNSRKRESDKQNTAENNYVAIY